MKKILWRRFHNAIKALQSWENCRALQVNVVNSFENRRLHCHWPRQLIRLYGNFLAFSINIRELKTTFTLTCLSSFAFRRSYLWKNFSTPFSIPLRSKSSKRTSLWTKSFPAMTSLLKLSSAYRPKNTSTCSKTASASLSPRQFTREKDSNSLHSQRRRYRYLQASSQRVWPRYLRRVQLCPNG